MRLIAAAVLALLALTASAVAADPMVELDKAKMVLADGKVESAKKKLAEINGNGAEDYVAEEILYHKLLLSGAFLRTTHYLLVELQKQDLADSAYYDWLSRQRDNYVHEFEHHARSYLQTTQDGSRLEFVRFRLPDVSDEYLQDTGLYSDVQVLQAAVSNWEDGRKGLGKGIIASQVRVALVLSVAVHYDLPESGSSLEQVAQRLRAGVPVNELVVLDWIAGTVNEIVAQHGPLQAIAETADERIIEALQENRDHHLYKQAIARRNAGAEHAS